MANSSNNIFEGYTYYSSGDDASFAKAAGSEETVEEMFGNDNDLLNFLQSVALCQQIFNSWNEQEV